MAANRIFQSLPLLIERKVNTLHIANREESRILLRKRLFFRTPDRQIDEEIRYHIERQVEQNIASGMPAGEARDAAMRQFGNRTQTFEDCHDIGFLQRLETVWSDLRQAFACCW